MRKTHIRSPRDVRRLLSRIVNEVLNNEIEVGRANCVGQLCNIILKAMEKSDLENRIERLERVLGAEIK